MAVCPEGPGVGDITPVLGRSASSGAMAQHREIARWYADALAGLGLTLPQSIEPDSHTYQSYVVLLPPAVAPRRADLIARLKTNGVETSIGTHHLPMIDWARTRGGYRTGDFPVTDDVARRGLALPMHSGLSRDDVACVADRLGAALRGAAA